MACSAVKKRSINDDPGRGYSFVRQPEARANVMVSWRYRGASLEGSVFFCCITPDPRLHYVVVVATARAACACEASKNNDVTITCQASRLL